jgi:hypothetical protein
VQVVVFFNNKKHNILHGTNKIKTIFFNELRVSACNKAIIKPYVLTKDMRSTIVIIFKLRCQLLTSVKIAYYEFLSRS